MSNVNPQLLKTALEISTIIMIQFSQKMLKDIIYKTLRQPFSIVIRNNDWKHKKNQPRKYQEEIVVILTFYPKDKVDRESQFWEGNVEQ